MLASGTDLSKGVTLFKLGLSFAEARVDIDRSRILLVSATVLRNMLRGSQVAAALITELVGSDALVSVVTTGSNY